MAAAIPYLLIAGSALLERKNQRDVEGRQKRIIDAMQQYQTGKAKQGQKSPRRPSAASLELKDALLTTAISARTIYCTAVIQRTISRRCRIAHQ